MILEKKNIYHFFLITITTFTDPGRRGKVKMEIVTETRLSRTIIVYVDG